MQTQDDVKRNFLKDLQDLLDKYGADIKVEDHFHGYAECGRDMRMTVTVPAIYNNGACVREWTDIDLGDEVSHNEHPETAVKKPESIDLWDADPNCQHELDEKCMSGFRCLKCGGWHCD